jgi:hypothetical protein
MFYKSLWELKNLNEQKLPKSIDTKVGKYKGGLSTKNTLLLNQNKLGIYKKVSIPIVNIKISSL